jgi:hypothetical protein
MSTLRVNKISNYNDDGPFEFTTGVVIDQKLQVDGQLNINTTGIVTATAFVGDGSNLTGLDSFLSKGQVISMSTIIN